MAFLHSSKGYLDPIPNWLGYLAGMTYHQDCQLLIHSILRTILDLQFPLLNQFSIPPSTLEILYRFQNLNNLSTLGLLGYLH